MVKSKQYECLLQQEINTNTQWELMLENDGLTGKANCNKFLYDSHPNQTAC